MSFDTQLTAIQKALEANTAALVALGTAWNALRTQADTLTKQGVTNVEAAGTPVNEAPPVNTTPTTTVETPAEATLEQLSASVTAAAKADREGLQAMLKGYNVERASQVPKDKWRELIAKADKIVADKSAASSMV
jgi:cytolysin (calcineurin-like family phosphatase)